MNDNIIAWNVTNWVTVGLMAITIFFVVGVLLKWRQTRIQKRPSSVNTTNGTVQTGGSLA